METSATGKKREERFEDFTAPDRPKPREVQVYILVNGLTGDISVVPEQFRVSKKNLQEVRWVCLPEKDFSVDFNKNGSPFCETHFDQDNPCSGLPDRKVQPLGDQRQYEYSVTVGGRTLDPQGVVDP